MFTYVIEHMEEDENTPKALPPWVQLEYTHMRSFAGPGATVRFTNLSSNSSTSLSTTFASNSNDQVAKAECHQQSILELINDQEISIDQVCLLDPKAENELSPEDGDGRFKMFLFGGILGDDPPRDRTGELRVLGFSTRHLGSVQMTTDTALGVTKIVIQDKISLMNIPYIDHPTIRFNAKESVEMPFRYILENRQPKLPPGMKKLLHEDLNKSFDF